MLDRIGHTPLPPYIHRDDANTDRDRYQTVFARERGSVAAPTAGLHFTPSVLNNLTKGIEIAHVTLHVGLGTFAPLRVERVEEVHLHASATPSSAEAADAINRAVAEPAASSPSAPRSSAPSKLRAPAAGGCHSSRTPATTEIFISPGFQFRLVGALLTNFHLPQSSLLMLVSAFAGREPVLAAYHHAIARSYRFFSYGDCMFIA